MAMVGAYPLARQQLQSIFAQIDQWSAEQTATPNESQ